MYGSAVLRIVLILPYLSRVDKFAERSHLIKQLDNIKYILKKYEDIHRPCYAIVHDFVILCGLVEWKRICAGFSYLS